MLSGVFLLAGGLLSGLAVLTLRTDTATEVTDCLFVLLVADATWAVSSVVPLEAATPEVALIGEVVRIAVSAVAAYVWFVFALVYSGWTSTLSRRRLAVLATPLAVHVLAVVTNPLHGASMSNVSVTVRPVTTMVSYDLGPVFLGGALYALVLVLAGAAAVAATALTDGDLYADQSIALLVGSVMPIVGVALTVSELIPAGSTNLTPATLTVTAVCFVYAVLRADLFTSGPLIADKGREFAVESLEEAFLIADESGRIVDANAAAEELLPTDPLGCDLASTLPIADDETGRTVFRIDGGTVLEAQITTGDEDGAFPVGRVVTLRDVTERRHRRERLQVLNRVLRHNLRNDLNAIRGFAGEIAAEDGRVESDEAAERILARTEDLLGVAENARALENLVSVERRGTAVVDVSSVLAACATDAAADRDGVTVRTDLPEECRVRADRSVLERVVEELLDNAVVHNTRATPTVELSAGVVDGSVCIRVTDDGPGIPDQDRVAVMRGRETPLEHASGLGLWAVRWGVDHLGGSLSIRNRSPTGTTVEIALPLAAEETEAKDAAMTG